MWTKSMHRLIISPLDLIYVFFSAVSHYVTNLIHPNGTTELDSDDGFNTMSFQDAQNLEHKLEGAILELDIREKGLEQLREKEVKHQEELDAKTQELANVTAVLEAKMQNIEAQNQKSLALVAELQTLNRNLEKNLQEQTRHTKEVEGQLKKSREDLEDCNRMIDSLQKRINSTSSILEARTAELKAMQSVFGEPDAISDFDAVKLVSALNAEIYQTAALLAESFGSVACHVLDGLDNRAATSRVRQMFGPRLVDLLKTVPHEENPLMLRVSFQACMVVFSDWIGAAWHFQSDSAGPAPQFFGEVYRNVWISEGQAVSGRWRSITRRHIQQLLNEQTDNIKARFAVHISNSLADVLLCAGLQNKHTQVSENIMALAGEKILAVVGIAWRLNRMLGEEITCADIETTWVHSQENFDPVWMEDDYADWRGSKHSAARVLCTTDLGLRRLVKSSNENGWEDTILLKPKVALEELLASLELNK